jgi:hypothetical protein
VELVESARTRSVWRESERRHKVGTTVVSRRRRWRLGERRRKMLGRGGGWKRRG